MRTTTRTKNKIKKFEGLRLKAYVCAAGVCTIGYGHTAGVKPGDVIEIKEKCKGSQRYKDIIEVTGGRTVPAWVEVDQENLKGEIKELPKRDEIDVPVDEMLIVELYSK